MYPEDLFVLTNGSIFWIKVFCDSPFFLLLVCAVWSRQQKSGIGSSQNKVKQLNSPPCLRRSPRVDPGSYKRWKSGRF